MPLGYNGYFGMGKAIFCTHYMCTHSRIKNVEADKHSKSINHDTEWILCPRFIKQALKMLNVDPNFYLFASRTHKQFPQYFSYIPDPEAIGVDAFTFEWANTTYYAFPHSLLSCRPLKIFNR